MTVLETRFYDARTYVAAARRDDAAAESVSH